MIWFDIAYISLELLITPEVMKSSMYLEGIGVFGGRMGRQLAVLMRIIF